MIVEVLGTISGGYYIQVLDAASDAGQRPVTDVRRSPRSDPGVLTVAVFCIAGLWGALSIDVVRTGFGIKGDEATYVAMALSAAHDGDLVFERRDLERFWREYQSGPEGIFLKRGSTVGGKWSWRWPFLQLEAEPELRTDRLYFGKAYLFSVAVAPFVRLAGLNGVLVLHVLLLAGVLWMAYVFLAARASAPAAILVATAFLGASITPLYGVWLTPEIFNFSLVFFGFFFWLYKEVAVPRPGWTHRWLTGSTSDVIAAAFLGLATFSKPLNLLLIVPIVGWYLWRGRWAHGVLTGAAFVAVVSLCFGLNLATTGELNYQGGERKTFYGRFPFEQPDAVFDNRGIAVATDDLDPENVLARNSAWRRLAYNARYFLLGRHFGVVPFFFPGFVALVLCVTARAAFRPWHALTLAAVGATAFGTLLWLPYTWSGGGGPLGNRYFLSVYPALFFLVPPLRSIGPGLIAWAGGAFFTAHILANPFVASRQPWINSRQGPLRMLPVELTAAYDLPAMLCASRCRIPFGSQGRFQLCYLDENAHLPDSGGVWIAGEARADIIVRSADPIERLVVTFRSPIMNVARIQSGGERHRVDVQPGAPAVVTIKPFGLRARYAYAYLISIDAERGFVPRLVEANSRDSRFLGVQIGLDVPVDGQ